MAKKTDATQSEQAAAALATDGANVTEDESVEQAPELVKMARDPALYAAPHEAEVHPDEVANYAAGGWVMA